MSLTLLEMVQQIFRQVVPQPPPAASLWITWGTPTVVPNAVKSINRLFKETTNMPVTLNPGQTVSFTVSPLDAQGNPSPAALSNINFTSSDPTVFTVAADPSTANGGIVTAMTPTVSPDAAVLSATALATEPDGTTTENISGVDTVTVQAPAPPPPPPPVAASLLVTWGTPQAKGK